MDLAAVDLPVPIGIEPIKSPGVSWEFFASDHAITILIKSLQELRSGSGRAAFRRGSVTVLLEWRRAVASPPPAGARRVGRDSLATPRQLSPIPITPTLRGRWSSKRAGPAFRVRQPWTGRSPTAAMPSVSSMGEPSHAGAELAAIQHAIAVEIPAIEQPSKPIHPIARR